MTRYDVWKLDTPPWYDEEPAEEEPEAEEEQDAPGPLSIAFLVKVARYRAAKRSH